MSCPDCEAAARNWAWGGYHSNCTGCLTRALARSPKGVRAAAYRQNPGIQPAVAAEYRRIENLRAEKTRP